MVDAEDTILPGLSPAHSNVGVAAIVFIASIPVPFTKVVVMINLLISIHLKCEQGLRTRILLLRFRHLDWPLVNVRSVRDFADDVAHQSRSVTCFTMGPAAFYFGSAVILTILAVEWLDSRLLWDAHESGNPRFAD